MLESLRATFSLLIFKTLNFGILSTLHPLSLLFFSTGDFYSLLSKLLGEREDVVHVHKYNPTEKAEAEADLVAEIANVVQKKDLGRADAREGAEREEKGNAILVRDRIHKFHRLESTLRPAESRVSSVQQPLPGEGTWESEHTGGAFRAFSKNKM